MSRRQSKSSQKWLIYNRCLVKAQQALNLHTFCRSESALSEPPRKCCTDSPQGKVSLILLIANILSFQNIVLDKGWRGSRVCDNPCWRYRSDRVLRSNIAKNYKQHLQTIFWNAVCFKIKQEASKILSKLPFYFFVSGYQAANIVIERSGKLLLGP